MNTLLVRDYFSTMAESWDDNTAIKPDVLKQIADLCDIKPGHRVIDIACGTGVMFPFILAKKPGLLVGVDVCESMVERACRKYSNKRLEVITQDFLQFDDKDFDRAVCYNAYPHFLDKFGFANKLVCVLKEGGRFVLAHGSCREHINAVHKKRASHISTPLLCAEEEKKWFDPYFDVDVVIDTADIYIISGTKN